MFSNGQLERTIPTSMGMGGSENHRRAHHQLLDPTRDLHRDGQGEPRRHGFLDLRPAHQLPAGLQSKPSTGPPASAPTASTCTPWRTPCGPGQHQRLPRLSEPQRRERRVVLQLLPARGHRRSPRHRRSPAATVAKRRLERPWAQWLAGSATHAPPSPTVPDAPADTLEKQGADGQPHADRGNRGRCCGSPPWSSPAPPLSLSPSPPALLRLGIADSAPSTGRSRNNAAKPR